MKKLTLAASVSLLMSSVAFANPFFTVDPDKAEDASYLMRRSAPIFKAEFDSLRQTDGSWDAELPKTTPKFERRVWEAALSDKSVAGEGTSHVGLLDNERSQWEDLVKGQLGATSLEYANFTAALAAQRGQLQSEGNDGWQAWRAGVLGKSKHTPAIGVAGDSGITWNPVESLILAALSGDMRYEAEQDAIYKALTCSGYLTGVGGGGLDKNRFSLETQLAGATSVVLGAARVLEGAKQRTIFGESNYLTGVRHERYVEPESDAVVVNSDPRANPDVVVFDYNRVLNAVAENSLESLTDASGSSARISSSEWLEMAATKIRPGGTLNFVGLGGNAKERTIQLLRAGFLFHSFEDGTLSYKRNIVGRALHEHIGAWEGDTFFNGPLYLKLNLDVAKVASTLGEGYAQRHWRENGRGEERLIFHEEFNPATYLLRNGDVLDSIYGADDHITRAVHHFVQHGHAETHRPSIF